MFGWFTVFIIRGADVVMGATFLTRIWSPVSVEAVVPKVLLLLGVSVVDVVLKLILLLKSNKSY